MLEDFLLWLQSVDRPFVFLLVLPFLVAAAGLLATARKRPLRATRRSPVGEPGGRAGRVQSRREVNSPG